LGGLENGVGAGHPGAFPGVPESAVQPGGRRSWPPWQLRPRGWAVDSDQHGGMRRGARNRVVNGGAWQSGRRQTTALRLLVEGRRQPTVLGRRRRALGGMRVRTERGLPCQRGRTECDSTGEGVRGTAPFRMAFVARATTEGGMGGIPPSAQASVPPARANAAMPASPRWGAGGVQVNRGECSELRQAEHKPQVTRKYSAGGGAPAECATRGVAVPCPRRFGGWGVEQAESRFSHKDVMRRSKRSVCVA